MPELAFEVVQESDGYCAECLTESIFTEADTWEEFAPERAGSDLRVPL